MPRAIFDANVLISAALNPRGTPGRLIERLFRDAPFDLVLSPAIMKEVLRALAYPKVRHRLDPAEDPRLWFEDIVALADLVEGKVEVLGACADPDDDKYLAAAIEGRAAFVVTGDRALLALKEHAGVRLITPRAFSDLLGS